MTTFQALRRAVGDKLNICLYGTIDASPAPGTLTFSDTDLSVAKAAEWRQQWCLFPKTSGTTTAWKITRVVSLTPTAIPTTVTLTAAVSPSHDVLDTWELWRMFSPIEVNEAINSTLRDQSIQAVRDETLVVIAGTRNNYAVPISAIKVRSVEYETDTADAWAGLRFSVYGSPGAYKIEFPYCEWSLLDQIAGHSLRISYEQHFPVLTYDGETTACPQAWLVSKVCAALFAGKLTKPQDPNRDGYKENVGIFESEAQMLEAVDDGRSRGPYARVSSRVSS